MSAHWTVTNGEPLSEAPLRRVGLGTLLAATARRHPERVLFTDPADKPVWSRRPAITWTYAAAAEIVERLARGIRAWRLPAGARVGLHLPASGESMLAHLAVEAAGHIPCPLPMAFDEAMLVTAVQAAGLSAVLTQTRFGTALPAERLCAVAARYFGLRYLAAFGPDVPDGVINLDRMILDERAPARTAPHGSSAMICFANGDPDRPMIRSAAALVGAAAAHLMALRIEPAERILTLLGPHDLRGLATGLAAALISGASLETLPVFSGSALKAALERDVPTHLVVPAFLERNLQGRPLPATLRSLCLVHRAPARFPGRVRSRPDEALRIDRVVDAVAFDETALVSGLRSGGGDVALVLGRPERLALPATLMAIRHEADGRLAFRGQACAIAPLHRTVAETEAPESWHVTPYMPLLFAGIATAVAAPEMRAQDISPTHFSAA